MSLCCNNNDSVVDVCHFFQFYEGYIVMSHHYTVAIVGRPNVGKSTLFNRLAGKQLAIVDNMPGVTRDWREAEGALFDKRFRVIDTAGLEENFDDSIQGRMRQKTEDALEHADIVLFVVDGRAGVTPLDQHFAEWLRRQNKPVILVVNKGENDRAVANSVGEAFSFGLGDPVVVSSAHGTGMEALYDALVPHLPEESEPAYEAQCDKDEFEGIDEIEGDESFEFDQDVIDESAPIKIAIAGRPNVGKSTLLNAMVKDERVMTGPEAGITRDAITVDWEFENRAFKLVDTAGLRRAPKVQDNIEIMSVKDTMRAIRLAQVVILVIDANMLMEKQDIQIADHIVDEGRAMVIAVNKWDIVKHRTDTLDAFKHKLSKSLAQAKDVRFVTTSGLNGKNIDRLMHAVIKTYGMWNTRVPTSGLNRWLARMESQNPAPLVNGRSNRLKYITQIKTRPPTFAMWVARPKELPKSYRRFIVNGLRRDFGIESVPVRLLVRASKNPFAEKAAKRNQ